jgi:hypothetical protein
MSVILRKALYTLRIVAGMLLVGAMGYVYIVCAFSYP